MLRLLQFNNRVALRACIRRVNSYLPMLREGKPCLLGSGDWDAGLVHVNNLVSVLIAAARSDYTKGEVFIAADGFGVTWKAYMNRLAQVSGLPAPKSLPNWLARVLAPTLEWLGHRTGRKERPLITRQSFRLTGGPNEFSTEKAHRLLGYQPQVTFEDAMQELAEHFAGQR